MDKQNKVRKSSLELLRIVCMMMIIGSHYAVHGGGNNWLMFRSEFTLNHAILIILGSWGELGVCGFIIISCYFMIGEYTFKFKRIFLLIIETVTYSVVWCLIGIGTGEISKKNILKEILTPLYGQYWFITTYIVFYFISPFLKLVIEQLSKEGLKKLCIILTFCIPCYNILWQNVGGTLADFIYIYFLMAYLLSKQGCFFEKHAMVGFIVTSWMIIVICLTTCAIGTVTGIEMFLDQSSRITGRNIFIIIDAVFMFYLFKNLKLKNSNIVNKFGRSTLGVYLIHDNVFLRDGDIPILWDRILKVGYWYVTPYFVVHMVLSIIFIFLFSSLIEMIRIKLVDDMIFQRLESLNKICERFDKWYIPKKIEIRE